MKKIHKKEKKTIKKSKSNLSIEKPKGRRGILITENL